MFTAIIRRLYFLEQHLSERLVCSDFMHLFLSGVFIGNCNVPFLNITSYSQFNIIEWSCYKYNADIVRNSQAFISVSTRGTHFEKHLSRSQLAWRCASIKRSLKNQTRCAFWWTARLRITILCTATKIRITQQLTCFLYEDHPRTGRTCCVV